MRRIGWLVGLAAGCSGKDGGEGTGTTEPIAAWACVHIAEGDLVDGATSRDEAESIVPGRTPYRVNLFPSDANFVSFDVDEPGDYTLLLDFAGAAPAFWEGETRTEIAPGGADPSCEEDLPELDTLTLAAGPHWLELGPVYQGSVWLVLGQ